MPISNPLVNQGSLNRVIASVSWPNFPGLNVTAAFLGREAIRFTPEGDATTFIGTLTGAVTSPEVYMMVTLGMHLLKTQSLAAAYQAQMQLDTRLGPGIVRPDVSTGIQPFQLANCAIMGFRELSFSGDDAGYRISCRGQWYVNSVLFNQA